MIESCDFSSNNLNYTAFVFVYVCMCVYVHVRVRMFECACLLRYTMYIFLAWKKSSVIRQKRESQNGCFKKTKHAKFSEKRTGDKKCLFFRKIWFALFS